MNARTTPFLRLFICLLFVLYTGIAGAHWYHDDLRAELADASSVSDAVETVQDYLKRRNFESVLVVDHQAAAAGVGLELAPTQVIFARPPKRLERALLRRSDTIGIDLPVKVLVFEDTEGVVQFRTNPPGYLIDRHELDVHDRDLRRLSYATRGIASPETGLITVPSGQSVADTVDELVAVLNATGAFRVPLTLDYGESFRWRNATLVVFGNPNAGTPLMQATQEIALDLPQKMLIWEDRHGDIYISYNDPFFIASRHDVRGQDARLTAISNALANFANIAAGN